MKNIYLLLGGNIGDSKQYIGDAKKMIETTIGAIKEESSLYQTSSWGKTNQPDFINQVIHIETEYNPQQLLSRTIAIENALGRQRAEKWGSRTIDIDILFYDNKIINEKELIIPHPHLHERRFTLIPLLEIAPEFHHPVLNQTIINLCNNLDDKLRIKKIS